MSRLSRIEIDLDELHSSFCFGVAGNFAGHLEQAGEAADFTNVHVAAELPKGIFAWFVPGAATALGTFPLSSDELTVPDPVAAPGRIQVEPELAVYCSVVRDGAGALTGLTPHWVAAFDDCSLRRPDARKISDKKNWGAASKGLAHTGFEVTDLAPDAAIATLRLACFLGRDGATHAYGVDSEVRTYTLIGEPLLDWLVERLHNQRGAHDTPLDDVGALLDASGATTVLVGVGASRYEPFGEQHFVEAGDEAVVVLYDSTLHEPEQVAELVAAHRDGELLGASVLRRVAHRQA